MRATVKNICKTLLVTALTLLFSLLLSTFAVGNESIIMVFLLGVLFTAVLTSSRSWAILAAIFSGMLFNFLYTEPRFSFYIYQTNDLMLIGFFIVTGVVSGTVTSRLQSEMKLANQNEQTAKTMYQIASGFLSVSGRESIEKKAGEMVSAYTGRTCVIQLTPNSGDAADGDSFPIVCGSARFGSLTLSGASLDEQRRLLVQAVCTQLGIALERETLVTDRENIRIAMEREQQRGTLLRSIAHDLRSPLTALSGAGNLLSDNYDNLSDTERRKLASDISEEIVWLIDLVENILNMTRISEQKLVLHKQDEVIDDVFGEAIEHTERLLRDRDLRVHLPEQVVTVPMDGKLIGQVIINLLENAARHTPANSKIILSAEIDDRLRVSVADTGDGIPHAIREHLFERFVTQNEEIVDGRRGLGLGLAICKAIVEAHGGEIHVLDNEPHGAVFTFTLPMEVQHDE